MEIIDDWLNDRGKTHCPGCEKYHIRCAVAAEIARLTAERDEALGLAVYVAKVASAGFLGAFYKRIELHKLGENILFEHDGTDAGILDALRRAKKASDGK